MEVLACQQPAEIHAPAPLSAAQQMRSHLPLTPPQRPRLTSLWRVSLGLITVLSFLLSATSALAVLKKGDRGPTVTALQLNLRRAGYSPGTIDGVFGTSTEVAVRNFQRSRGLTADGVVGPSTEAALTSGGSGSSGGSSSQPRSSQIAEVQRLLVNQGCYQGAIDGVAGPRTTAAIMAAQRSYGLSVDGIAGPATVSALRTARCRCF